MFAQTACTTDNNMISKVYLGIQYILAGVEKWLTIIYVTFPYHTPTYVVCMYLYCCIYFVLLGV